MDKKIEYAIDKSIERVFQSWFCKDETRQKVMVATSHYLTRIYDIVKSEPSLKDRKTSELMELVGLDYGKVYKNGRRMLLYSIEEGVHDSLQNFMATIKDENML